MQVYMKASRWSQIRVAAVFLGTLWLVSTGGIETLRLVGVVAAFAFAFLMYLHEKQDDKNQSPKISL